MKLRLVPKSGDEKKEELKRKIAEQQRRFDEASMKAADALRRGLSIRRWVREYPLETALFAVASGIILAQTVERLMDRAAGESQGRESPLQPPPFRPI